MWNPFRTKQERDPTTTEILANMVRLEEEWRSFLEQQARVSRRAAKRVRDDAGASEAPEEAPPGDKAAIRRLAIQKGMFTSLKRAQ